MVLQCNTKINASIMIDDGCESITYHRRFATIINHYMGVQVLSSLMMGVHGLTGHLWPLMMGLKMPWKNLQISAEARPARPMARRARQVRRHPTWYHGR